MAKKEPVLVLHRRGKFEASRAKCCLARWLARSCLQKYRRLDYSIPMPGFAALYRALHGWTLAMVITWLQIIFEDQAETSLQGEAGDAADAESFDSRCSSPFLQSQWPLFGASSTV